MNPSFRHYSLSLVLLLVHELPVAAQIPSASQIQSPKAKSAIEAFQNEKKQLDTTYWSVIDEMNTKYDAAITSIKNGLLDALEKARKQAALDDDLDEAILLRDAAGEVEKMEIKHPTLTPSTSTKTNNPADIPVAKLGKALMGTWRSREGLIWEVKEDNSYASNHPVFKKGSFFMRSRDGVVYLAILGGGGKIMTLVVKDMDTILTLDRSFTLKRKTP